jgi:hypothetical protein
MLNIQKFLLVTLTVAVAMAGMSFGQRTDATFAGLVTDPSGAVLPGAEVQMINDGTAAVTQQLTGETGEFRFDFLPVGVYTLKIVMAGFKSYQNQGIPLGAAQNVRRTYALEVGSITDSVTVTGEAPLVNTISPEQRMSLETLEVRNLPMINRNITTILDIGSGLTRGEASNNGMAGTRFRLNGLGGSSMSVTANGTDANGNAGPVEISGYGGYNKIEIMSSESVAEVQVVKGVMAAEYGGAMSGNLSLITKSGTNDWHGSLFHRYEGSLLSARQPFLTQEQNSVWNQFGGSLGGPIKKDKAFFFAAYEGYRQRTALAMNPPPTVPTQRFRDILLSSLPFPETKLFLDHVPLPNQPHAPDALLGVWFGSAPKVANDDHVDVKADYMIGGGNFSVTLYGGHPYAEQTSQQPLNPQYTTSFTRRLSVNYVLGRPRWTSSTRFGYNHNFFERIDKLWLTKDPNRDESFPGQRRLPVIAFSGMSGFNRENRLQGPIPSYSMEQQFSFYRGAHSWKFGGIFSLPRGGRPDTTATLVTFQNVQDVMRNEPAAVSAESKEYPFTWRMINFGFFAQDDWRVHQKLVLNLGVRYDSYGPYVATGWKGDFGRALKSYDMKPEVLKNLVGKLPMAVYNLDGLIDPVNFSWGPQRDPNSPYNRDNLSIGPRFGFAYTVDSTGDFVVRGGFGVNFQSYDALGGAAPPPYESRGAFTRAEALASGLKYPAYGEDVTAVILAQNPQRKAQITARLNPDLRPPYAMNYTLGIQRALTRSMVLETAFLGTRGVKFDLVRPFNNIDRITALRPNPNDITGTYRDNSQQTNYNSWQSSLKQRLSHGLLFNIHHTWGKALSYTGGDISTGSIGDTRTSIEDFDQVKIERGLSTGDVAHYVAVDWVYAAPTPFANSAVGRHVLGGWQIAGIWRGSTGPAIGDRFGITQTGGRPDLLDIDGAVNKNCCGFGNLQFLNPAAFRLVDISRASNRTVRRGTSNLAPVRGPGYWNVDLSLGKRFSLAERTDLELKADMQNVLNHTQYTTVSTNLSGVDFGRVVATRSARVVQLQLRLTF